MKPIVQLFLYAFAPLSTQDHAGADQSWTVAGKHGTRRSARVAGIKQQPFTLKDAADSLQLVYVNIKGDGNCLVRGVARRVYGDEDYHAPVREAGVAMGRLHLEQYAPFFESEAGTSSNLTNAYVSSLTSICVV